MRRWLLTWHLGLAALMGLCVGAVIVAAIGPTLFVLPAALFATLLLWVEIRWFFR
jgi:hypothetical protein